MDDYRKLEIKFNKQNIILLLISSLILTTLGIWFAGNPSLFTSTIVPYDIVIVIFGVICTLFFGLMTLYNYKKLSDNSPGLIIDEEGIIDNSSGFSADKIPWRDVTQIRSIVIFKQPVIILELGNPNDYIEKERNLQKQKAMKTNLNMYGAPFGISVNRLKISTEELKSLLEKRLEDFRMT